MYIIDKGFVLMEFTLSQRERQTTNKYGGKQGNPREWQLLSGTQGNSIEND